MGSDFDTDLSEIPQVVKFRQSLQFFSVHKLFTGADKLLELLEQFIKSSKDMITLAKKFKELNEEGQ